MNTAAPRPPPEVQKLIKEWCSQQEQKYGQNWKSILAAEMSKQAVKDLTDLGVIKK